MLLADSIGELLQAQGRSAASNIAMLAPDRQALTYRRLLTQFESVGRVLRACGLGQGDRVAVVLPNGAELVAAFLTLSAWVTVAPLNPAYLEGEFHFYLTDLRAKALLIRMDDDSPARSVAKALGIPILTLAVSADAEAGIFELHAESAGKPFGSGNSSLAEAADIALVLHTSGTTSRPKIVPLTHRNLCSSARHIASTLSLTSADRCLNVMPLFHIHGLIGALLSSITASASVVCTPGLLTPRFFEWIDQFQPTWYTAVPTMHQAILDSATANTPIIQRRPLRFIRSSSAALAPRLMQEMECVFGAPVIESYGMTEASHQMTSNPLPPRPRKPGSVGFASGPEVAVMDEKGELLPPDRAGEIVIRGPNVTPGYENNSKANETAFTDGWFRTGDHGHVDADGYFFITGRIKEIINRGGEKIAPSEIDEALMNHPGVRQAVAFAVAHPTLGEDIAAAVVAKDGQSPSESELREFVARYFPAFKVPSRIVLLNGIPTGPTGKIQRNRLAEQLAKELATQFESPGEGLEHLVASTMKQILQCPRVGRNDNFFALGGDSIRATQVLLRLAKALGIKIPLVTLFNKPTVALLAAELARLQGEQKLESLAAELAKLPPGEAARLLRKDSEGDT